VNWQKWRATKDSAKKGFASAPDMPGGPIDNPCRWNQMPSRVRIILGKNTWLVTDVVARGESSKFEVYDEGNVIISSIAGYVCGGKTPETKAAYVIARALSSARYVTVLTSNGYVAQSRLWVGGDVKHRRAALAMLDLYNAFTRSRSDTARIYPDNMTVTGIDVRLTDARVSKCTHRRVDCELTYMLMNRAEPGCPVANWCRMMWTSFRAVHGPARATNSGTRTYTTS
jgi:hypothetical protein